MKFNLMSITGLPRTGSTFISGVFSQHEDVHIEGTSGLPGIISATANVILDENGTNHTFLKANDRIDKTLRGIVPALIEGFYYDNKKPFVIDKSRSWTSPVVQHCMNKYYDSEFKMVVMTRSICKIVESFAKLVDKEQRTDEFYYKILTDSAPIKTNMINIIKMAESSQNNVIFMDYEDILQSPNDCIESIRKFFGLSCFNYDLNILEKYVPENDDVYIYKNLHKLRNGVSKNPEEINLPVWVKEQADEMTSALKDFSNIYQGSNQWHTLLN